jgi:nucleotidyltransferase substrate binding protein (TIGR01987 family)
MELSRKFKEDLLEYNKAFLGFEKILDLIPNNYTEIEADAIKNGWLQKFEYCTELAWKVGKVFLELQTGQIVNNPKGVYRLLYLSKFIDEKLCDDLFQTLNDRNKMSHIYKEEMFQFVIENIQNHKTALFKIKAFYSSYN